MRNFILILTFILVILPALLILFARHKPIKMRIIWGIGAFTLPFIMLGLVQILPQLTNNSVEAGQLLRFLGVALSGAGFFLPWVVFAIFFA